MPGRATNDVIVLVEPDRFDPAVDPATFVHPTWVRWPEAVPPPGAARVTFGLTQPGSAGDSRLLAITSGLDWQGGVPLTAFSSQGTLRAAEFKRLSINGYFAARARNLGNIRTRLLPTSSSALPLPAMLLALNGDSPSVPEVGVTGPWPSVDLMVMKAGSGADIALVQRRTSGRVLVIEYPPPARTPNWSRLWLLGHGWPSGEASLLPKSSDLEVPGLVAAHDLARLALRPDEFRWQTAPPGWPGANRWFSFVQSTRPWDLGGIFVVFAGLVVTGAAFVAQERRSAVLAGAARAFTLAPAALVAGGNLARAGGLPGGTAWCGIAWVILVGLASIINLGASRAAEWEPLTGYAITSFAGLVLLDPRYSVLGNVFERGAASFPGEAYGALLGSFALLAMVIGARRGGGLAAAGFLALAFDAGAVFGRPWWSDGTLPSGDWWLVGAAAGLGAARLAAILVPIATSLRIWAMFSVGFTFLVPGLVERADQVGGLNLAEMPRFLLSPMVLGSGLVAGLLALWASRFFAHQVRAAWRERPAAHALAILSAALLAGGLLQPPLLRAGMIVAFGAVLVLLEELMRPRELVD